MPIDLTFLPILIIVILLLVILVRCIYVVQ